MLIHKSEGAFLVENGSLLTGPFDTKRDAELYILKIRLRNAYGALAMAEKNLDKADQELAQAKASSKKAKVILKSVRAKMKELGKSGGEAEKATDDVKPKECLTTQQWGYCYVCDAIRMAERYS